MSPIKQPEKKPGSFGAFFVGFFGFLLMFLPLMIINGFDRIYVSVALVCCFFMASVAANDAETNEAPPLHRYS
jgi:hypothetical protein